MVVRDTRVLDTRVRCSFIRVTGTCFRAPNDLLDGIVGEQLIFLAFWLLFLGGSPTLVWHWEGSN